MPLLLLLGLTTRSSLLSSLRGKGKFLEVVVHRARKSVSGAGEIDAVKMSELLPFTEFDLQKQLMLKLKVLGMNAAMSYTTSVTPLHSILISSDF
jgi:hypothetical protein